MPNEDPNHREAISLHVSLNRMGDICQVLTRHRCRNPAVQCLAGDLEEPPRFWRNFPDRNGQRRISIIPFHNRPKV